jgi:hypothetical protein
MINGLFCLAWPSGGSAVLKGERLRPVTLSQIDPLAQAGNQLLLDTEIRLR